MNGGSQEGTGGFGQAGKQCPRSIIYSWVPRRRASSWQRAARSGWDDSCLSSCLSPLSSSRPPSFAFPEFFLVGRSLPALSVGMLSSQEL